MSNFIMILFFSCFISTKVTAIKVSTPTNPICRVAVIGGGAAGYFSSIECAKTLKNVLGPNKYEVVIFEAGKKPLSKVIISGGGRCNVMHDPRKGPKEISKGYPRGYQELVGPLSKTFGPDETYTWFTTKGVVLKVEEDGRVFPTTDRSETIAMALEKEAHAHDVKVITSAHVNSVTYTPSVTSSSSSSSSSSSDVVSTIGNKFQIEYNKGRNTISSEDDNGDGDDDDKVDSNTSPTTSSSSNMQKEIYICDHIIMATGSSRKGYEILKQLGHTVITPLPSLFSFKVKNDQLTELSGLTSDDVMVKLTLPKELRSKIASSRGGTNLLGKLSQRGPIMITHQGFSGPSILRLSAFGAKVLSDINYNGEIEINWLPTISAEELIEHLNAQRARIANKLVGTWFPPMYVDDAAENTPESYYYYDDLNVVSTQQQQQAVLGGSGPSIWSSSSSSSSSSTGSSIKNAIKLKYEQDLHRYGVTTTSSSSSSNSNSNSNIGLEDNIAPPGQKSIPRRMWQYMIRQAGMDEKTMKWGSLTKIQILALVDQILRQKHIITGRGAYRDEFVTCGGVQLKDISLDKMESKVVPGLYLAGEVLDIDGITGGYNFQAAWTGGWIAGHSCAEQILQSSSSSITTATTTTTTTQQTRIMNPITTTTITSNSDDDDDDDTKTKTKTTKKDKKNVNNDENLDTIITTATSSTTTSSSSGDTNKVKRRIIKKL